MIFPIIMLASLLFVVAATVFLGAISLLHPPRMTDGKALALLKRLTPADLNLQFESVKFSVTSTNEKPIDLAAWWMPHPASSEKTVLLIHGYADAKVGAIAWAPTWQSLGFNILAIDLRAHGESGGAYITAGNLESHDLSQAIDQLRAAKANQTREIVLFGISYGGAIALHCACARDDITATILECPYATFAQAIQSHATARQLPLAALAMLNFKIANILAGLDLNSVSPLIDLPRTKCPVFMIQSGNDFYVSEISNIQLRKAIQQRTDASSHWIAPNAGHLLAMQNDPGEYERQLRQFLDSIARIP